MMSSRWLEIAGQTAVVTGAASGIGRATAIALAEVGARVLACDIDELGAQQVASEICGRGGDAVARRLDVTIEAEWAATAQWIEREWVRLDALVNSAGVALRDSVGDPGLGAYHRTFSVNVEGTLLGMAMALRFMRAARKGAIVNISSTASFRGSQNMASYAASKAAVASFTRSAAIDIVRSGFDIRINSVHPGLIETRMAEDFSSINAKLGSAEQIAPQMTTGRPGRPEEVADLILFLLSDDASFISGTGITIDRAHST
jgi:NAD(P)-dependent dehydrogenase (short-subunit alcohol dehydrogenase family)